MKKSITLLAAVFMMAASLNAQVGYDDTKHEVAVSYGFGSNSQWLDIFEDAFGGLFGGQLKDERFVGPITAEYFYHIKKWLGVGGMFIFGQNRADMIDDGETIGKTTNNYISLMPAVKFDWLRRKNIGLYSKLALGATYRHETDDYNAIDSEDRSDGELHFNWQISAVGFEAGNPYFRGFLELGCGEQGIAIIGARYKF